ncbi:MAG: hypothetical protein JXK05_07635 [Campylobacterales bacterium]|nr:hypothetical protein [Campylobacterales bacterium]
MKLLTLFAMISATAWGCTGDCLTCHPNLIPTIQTDLRHKPMLGCIECHSADPDSMAECGSDCFGCHKIEKIESVGVAQHAVIRECRDCHLQMQEAAFTLSQPLGQSVQKPLCELLIP